MRAQCLQVPINLILKPRGISMIAQLKNLGVKLFPGSLRKRACSEARKTLFNNPRWTDYRYHWTRNIVHGINAHRWWFLGLVAVTYLSGAVLAALIAEISWGPKTPGGLEDYFRDLQSLNLTILGVQASFIGLVFPIVIALADSLSSGRIGLSGRISIFLKETEANGTAFSSVMLIIVVLGQSLFLPQWPDRVVAAITFGNIAWAIFNLWLIVRFLTEAIRYLQPQNRRKMVNRYVANSALPELLTSMEMRLAFDRLAQSLPGDLDAEFTVYDLGRAENAKRVRANNTLDVSVHDVRPRRLRRVLKQLDDRSKKTPSRTIFRCQFELSPAQRLRPEGSIATVLPDEALTQELEDLLIASFELVDLSDQPSDEVEQLLAEFANDLILLLQSGQLGQFEATADEAIDLLVFALAISGNYSFDGDFRKSWFTHRKQWISWMLVFRHFVSEVAKRARQQPAFFERVSYMGYRFQTGLPTTMLSEAYIDSLWLSAFLVREFCADLQQAITDDRLHPQTKDIRVVGALAAHVGAWEAQARLWSDHVRREEASPQTAFPGYKSHYDRTITSCFLACKSGHIDTARWFTDQAIKWENGIRDFEADRHDYLIVSRSSITISDVVADVDLVKAEHSLREDHLASTEQIFQVALKNYANDGRTILLLAILRELKARLLPESKIAAARDLITGKPIDDGENGYGEPRGRKPADCFVSMLRMEMTWEHQTGSYNNLMSELSSSLVRENEPPRVSMRGYSGFGSNGVSSFGFEQAELLLASAALTNTTELNSVETAELLASIADQVSRDALHERLQLLAERVTELDFATSAAAMLLSEGADQEKLGELKSDLNSAISALAKQVSTVGDEEFDRAEFDDEKIAQIARWAGSKIQPHSSNQFPLSLFSASELIRDGEGEAFQEYTLNMNGLSFGSISKPQLSAIVSNEQEWWSDLPPEHLANAVLRDVYRELTFEEVTLQNPEDLWEMIQGFAEANDRSTSDYVLTVPSHGAPEWMREWSWRGDARPENVVVSRQTDQPRGYMQHINDLAVFSGFSPDGVMCLIDRSSFERLDFIDTDTGPVSISPAKDASDIRKADLALLTCRRVTVKGLPALEIRFEEDT
jgi:hypothetical protein